MVLTKEKVIRNSMLAKLMLQRDELESTRVDMGEDLKNPYSQRILSKYAHWCRKISLKDQLHSIYKST